LQGRVSHFFFQVANHDAVFVAFFPFLFLRCWGFSFWSPPPLIFFHSVLPLAHQRILQRWSVFLLSFSLFDAPSPFTTWLPLCFLAFLPKNLFSLESPVFLLTLKHSRLFPFLTVNPPGVNVPPSAPFFDHPRYCSFFFCPQFLPPPQVQRSSCRDFPCFDGVLCVMAWSVRRSIFQTFFWFKRSAPLQPDHPDDLQSGQPSRFGAFRFNNPPFLPMIIFGFCDS